MAPKRKRASEKDPKPEKHHKPLCPLRTAIVHGDAQKVKELIEKKSPGEDVVELINLALEFGHDHVFLVLVNCNIPNDDEAWECVDERIYCFDSPIVYEALRARGLIDEDWLDKNFEELLRFGAVNMVKHVNMTGTLDIQKFMLQVEFDAIQELYEMGHVTVTPESAVKTLYDLVWDRDRDGIRWLLERVGHLIDKDAHADKLWDIMCRLAHGFNRKGIFEILYEFDVLTPVRKSDNHIISAGMYSSFLTSLPEVKLAAIQGEDFFEPESDSE